MTNHTIRPRPRGAGVLGLSVLLAALAGGCGDPQSPEGAPAGTVAPVRTLDAPGPAAPSPAALPPVAKLADDLLPPRVTRAPEPIEPSVEECIERNIHDARYDAMGPRDARRKLRRLEVKADCESRMAAR